MDLLCFKTDAAGDDVAKTQLAHRTQQENTIEQIIFCCMLFTCGKDFIARRKRRRIIANTSPPSLSP